MGFTELLIESEDRPAVRQDLEQIRRDAGRAAQIVHHLLLFARRETLEREVADLNEIVRSTVALRTFDLRTRMVDVREHYSANVPLVVANREQIQQIVLNLMLNAEHVLRETGRRGEISVRTGETDDAAFVDVSDDGPGVPAEVAGLIFEPFFTTKAVGEGTGLGLSVSLGIARAHSGSLELLPGGPGACFRLTLPSASVAHVQLSAMPVGAQ